MKPGKARKALTGIGLLMLASIGFWPTAAQAQTVEYYHLDAVGNVLAVTDTNGTVIEEHDYYPFGEECTTAPCASRPGTQPKRFTGKERDNETGLDYFGARYYSSKFGRFTTIDPVYTWGENLADPQRWNRYAYVRNNPLRYVDPDGRVPVPVILWGAYEVGSAAYDGYTAVVTSLDANATTGEKAAAIGGALLGAVLPGGGYGTAGKAAVGKADDVVNAMKRGRESEARVLEALGETKNTAKVKGCEGCSIPDYQNPTTVGEIKDAVRVDNTRQIRIQRDAARESGKQHVVHTGTNTSVSKEVERRGTIVRRQDDLGPKQ